ncbi:PREDICTED: myb-related protein 305 [Prunus mume]|uniref:Myb-related protein 305 n=1 Tax=Prunus mume TaxID=102107 RepID=A0ABM0NZZ6_PRUMU|nr:PREDICTED: myb-related protein 305 [Prunus mume]
MEGRREEGIRKGPWKAEEDEVLFNHVKKCGPRDWSSIRSKGLLQRTGKSCRLRWVNKLRPNLKNGCKFSLEEERVVIDLQAQFGNKWARIATYLPGRTDNDVKNFWSSRQKRLARILQASAPSKSHKNKREGPVYDEVITLEAPKFSCSSEGESSSQAQSCSSPPCFGNSEIIKMVPLPDLVKPKLLALEANPVQQELAPTEKNPWIEPQPLIPFLQNPQPQTDLDFSLETQELLARFDPYFDMLTPLVASELGNGGEQLLMEPPFLEPVGSCGSGERDKIGNPITPDFVFDDLPVDMFDQIELLPNSSEQH